MRLITAAVGLAAVLALTTACASPKTVTKASPPAASTPAGPAATPSGGPVDDKVAYVGMWATAEDGVAFRVSKLAKGRVSDIASGGSPGDPAVIVTVQLRNDSDTRFDTSGIQVTARVGKDGNEAEQVFQDSFGEGFTGTIGVGRTATARFMFAAKSAADLKEVSVEIQPGFDYSSFTFEGSV